MKASFFLCFAILCASLLNAQTDCRPYLPVEEGTEWEISNYNAKDKLESSIRYKLLSVETEGSNTTFTVETTSFDKKAQEVYTNTFTAACVDGQFQFDMSYRIDGNSMQAYQDMEVDIDASQLSIPNLDAPVGATLPDGNLLVGIGGGGPINLNMRVDITNRTVEARESVTTPAGTFDCVVLSQTVRTKMVVAVQATSKEWYAERVGVVRSESYNKKGKLIGYSELTMLKRS